MNYVKQICMIFGITMIGELLNACLPLPIPAGVYGLFLLLAGLCTKMIKLSDVEDVGNFLLDIMPMMFIPAAVGLLESYETAQVILIPLIVISMVTTVIVMIVTGKTTDFFIGREKKTEDKS